MQAAKALVSLYIYADSPELLLLANEVSTKLIGKLSLNNWFNDVAKYGKCSKIQGFSHLSKVGARPVEFGGKSSWTVKIEKN